MFEAFVVLVLLTLLVLVIVAISSLRALKDDVRELQIQLLYSPRLGELGPAAQPSGQQPPLTGPPAQPQPQQAQQTQPGYQHVPPTQPAPEWQAPQVAFAQASSQPAPAFVPAPVPQQHMPVQAQQPSQQQPPQQQPSHQQQPQPQPQQQYAPPAPAPAQSAPAPTRSMESILGKNIVGIVASVLVFIGLVFLGFLVVPYLTDIVKVIAMFAISGALTATGLILHRRFTNSFTESLLGTGCGAFFIAILITHLYFQMFNDIVAFSLLLLWLVAALWLARFTNSLLVSILAHVGMVVSICAAYGVALSDSKLVLLLIYQFVSSIVLIVGNILCSKRMYRFGLFASLALMAYVSIVMWMKFDIGLTGFNTGLPTELIVAAFIAQFIGGSVVAYLLFISCARARSTAAQVLLQLLNLALWLIILVRNVSMLTTKLTEIIAPSTTYQDGLLASTIVTLVIVLAAMLVTVIVCRRRGFGKAIEVTTVIVLSAVAAMSLLINAFMFGTPHLISYYIPAIALMILAQTQKSAVYAWLGRSFLIAELVLMTFFGYPHMIDGGMQALVGRGEAELILAFVMVLPHLFLQFALWVWAFRLFDDAQRARYRHICIAIVFIVLEVVLFSIAAECEYFATRYASFEPLSALGQSWDIATPLVLLLAILAAIILHARMLDRPLLLYRINEYALCFALAIALVTVDGSLQAQLLLLAGGVACIVMMIERIRCVAVENSARLKANFGSGVSGVPGMPGVAGVSGGSFGNGIEAITAFAINVLFLAILENVFSFFDAYYSFSLSCMFVALVIIVLGFWSRARSLRIYGLVLVIICVLKLVTIDIAGLDLFMRVIAFIGGGLICFGISAVYNFAVKRFESEQRPAMPAPAHTGAPSAPVLGFEPAGQAGYAPKAPVPAPGPNAPVPNAPVPNAPVPGSQPNAQWPSPTAPVPDAHFAEAPAPAPHPHSGEPLTNEADPRQEWPPPQ